MSNNLKSIGTLDFNYRIGTCDEVILNSDEYQKSRFFSSDYTLYNNHIILDIGAHIGVFSLLAAEKVPKGKVYSIEADEENYRYLRKNIKLNKLPNIKTYLLALSDYQGIGKLYSSRENWAHTLSIPISLNYSEVKTDTLSNFISINKIDHIDYLKMNVEGEEYRILLSTPKNILKKISFIFVEFHPLAKYNERDLMRYLEQSGFELKIQYSKTEKGKGWISAIST